MNRLIITMPIAPYNNYSIGKLSTPILAQSLAKKINGKFVLSVNLFDSYKTREILPYQQLLQNYQVTPYSYWIDKENINKLINNIYLLIEKNYIREDYKKILHCKCKKVEICIDNIKTINMIDSCFTIYDKNYYCKSCKTKCIAETEKVLVFNPNLIDKTNLKFYPEFINKDIKTFHQTVGTNDIIISRQRPTGIKITCNNSIYNIDVDFLWQTYLSLFNEEEKIVLCSNHQLYQLYMALMLEKSINSQAQTIGLATPYINANKIEEKELENRLLSLKLFILFNFKWAKKENIIDNGLINYLNSMNVNKKEKLYNIIMQENISTPLIENLKEVLIKDFNFQNANKTLKRSRKNV